METKSDTASFETRDGLYALPDKRTTDEKVQDGFQNFAAKIGIGPGRFGFGVEKNLLSQGHYTPNLITRNRLQLEYAYRGSWIAGKIIDCPAEDMTREGINITTNEEAEKVTDFKAAMTRLNIMGSFADTIRWGRLYGGAVGILQIEGQNLAKPLRMETVSKGQFKGIAVYDRWQVWPVLNDLIDSGPEAGLPKFYDIVIGTNITDPGKEPGFAAQEPNGGSYGRVRVHHSRLFRAGGHKLPFYQAITEMLWDESILERMWDRLIAFDDATFNAFGLISKALLRVVKFANLREVMAAGGEAEKGLRAQVEFMRQMQSNENLTALDKEDEFDDHQFSFAGVPDLLLQSGQQVSGAGDIPLIRLFCQSPSGMNATGDSDLRMYYDGIKMRQESKMRTPLDTVLKVMWLSEFGTPAPKDFQFTFIPLWQLSAVDRSSVAKTTTETVLGAVEKGVISSATALKELKQAAPETNLFTHITDEDIEQAEEEPPPSPDEDPGAPGEGSSTPENLKADKGSKIVPLKKASGDSAFTRFVRFINRDKRSAVKKQQTVDTSTKSEPQQVKDARSDHQCIKDWLAKQR